MLSMFMLMLQAATLDVDNAKAATQCTQAYLLAEVSPDSAMKRTSQATYLGLRAAVEQPSGGAIFDQLAEFGTQAFRDVSMTWEQARALVPPCDRRFPLARSTGTPKLPSDSFRRDLMCFGTLSLLRGVAEDVARSGDDSNLSRIEAALRPLTDRLSDDELKRHGIHGDAEFSETLGDALVASTSIGNPFTLAAACGAALD